MRSSITFIIKYFLFWLLFFFAVRLLFLIYNMPLTSGLDFGDITGAFFHGLKMDISMTGYVVFFMTFFMVFTFFRVKIITVIAKVYTYILLVMFSLISVVDIELYRNWGFRIDSTIMLYLQTPKESMASTPLLKVFMLFVLLLVFVWVFIKIFEKYIISAFANSKNMKWYVIPVFLFISAFMIIPIRGGLGIAPINQGTVFFSPKQYANHSALNVVWNFGKSLTKVNEKQNLQFMSDKVAKQTLNSMFTKRDSLFTYLLKEGSHNVVIILLESFTGNVVEPLGGVKGATPNLSKLIKQGVFFDHCYASGDRSDKGIISVLSGYPAQPTTSIIRYITKTEKLPYLSKDLKKRGYTAGFYYGGEINFANMNSYFINGGYETVSLKDFDKKDLNSKWGAHDHVVFNRFYNDLIKLKQPFFRVMFTLSSHEPYDVPHKSSFTGTTDEQMFLNSVHYTDSCLGDFFNKMKKTELWNNTLFILVADHGKQIPGNVPYSSPKKFKIPMLWLGGVIEHDTVIHHTVSQIDIPLMLENQLQISSEGKYKFSKDVLNGQNAFAFYAYNNGFGFYNDSCGFVWDNSGNRFVFNDSATVQTVKEGKAFMQELLNDFNSK